MAVMKKIKIADAPNRAIDWLVAKAECLHVTHHDDGITRCVMKLQAYGSHLYAGRYQPTTDPALAWPIIDREGITVGPNTRPVMSKGNYAYRAHPFEPEGEVAYGSTGLIAAMRCYAASVYGEEAEVPEELLT